MRQRATCFYLLFPSVILSFSVFFWVSDQTFTFLALSFCLIQISFFLSSLFSCHSTHLQSDKFDYTLWYIINKSTKPLHTLEITSLIQDKVCHPFIQFFFLFHMLHIRWRVPFLLGSDWKAFPTLEASSRHIIVSQHILKHEHHHGCIQWWNITTNINFIWFYMHFNFLLLYSFTLPFIWYL